jgi:hypothetical protein
VRPITALANFLQNGSFLFPGDARLENYDHILCWLAGMFCGNKKTAGTSCGELVVAILLEQSQTPPRRAGKVIPTSEARGKLLTAGNHGLESGKKRARGQYQCSVTEIYS